MAWTVDGLTYTKRKKVTISKTKVDEDLTDFPLCVRIVADTDIGAVCKSDGTDLRFTDASNNLLYCEIGNFAVSTGSATGNFWVKVPTIATANNTDCYCYYGNGSASSQANPQNVWSNGYLFVAHYKEGTGTTINNSVDGASATIQTSAPGHYPAWITGLIGTAIDTTSIEATSVWADFGDNYRITGNTFTITSWIKMFSNRNNENFLCKTNYGSISYPNGKIYTYFKVSGTQYSAQTTNTYGDSNWHMAQSIYDNAHAKILVDGGETENVTGQAVTGNVDQSTDHFTLWAYPVGNPYFHGYIDEQRVATSARSIAWCKFEYYSQIDAAQLTFGSEEVPTVTGQFMSTNRGMW